MVEFTLKYMHSKWLNYWKNSLSDSQRLQVDFEKEKHFVLKEFSVENDDIPFNVAEQLFKNREYKYNIKRGIKGISDPNWILLKNIDVLISVFTIIPIADHFANSKSNKPSYPFWIQAILNRDGKLLIPEEPFPLIPRPYLTPSAGKAADFIFSDVDIVDKAAAISTNGIKNWKTYWEYIIRVFEEITQQSFEEYNILEYRINQEIIVFSPDNEQGAASGIINLYQYFTELGKIPKLLSNLINLKLVEEKEPQEVNTYMDILAKHLGQMGDEYPLSITQRKTLNTYLTSKENTVFAVNGPPGTGKTTLLQSIVANKIVTKAIQGNDPPCILACSTNNQAVQNINESFSKTESSLDSLNGRWLPDFKGYASYLPSNKKPLQELININFIKLDGSGTFKNLEDLNYVDKANEYFLNKISQYNGNQYSRIEDCAESLQKEIVSIQLVLEEFSKVWKQYQDAYQSFIRQYDMIDDKNVYVENDLINLSKINNDIQWFEAVEKSVLSYFSNESFLRKLGCFFRFKSSLKSREIEVNRLFRECPVNHDETIYSNQNNCLHACDIQIKILKHIKTHLKKWNDIRDHHQINNNPPQSEKELWVHERKKQSSKNQSPCYFYDEMDILFRHKAFQLAIHYWEARWLIEVKDYLFDEKKDSKGLNPSLRRWRMRSMLTPCYVCTFYMAPKFISYWRFDRETQSWANPPLLNLVDILMVDEAGQTTPEVGAAIFGLANRAIVVGDIKQIEPIWNIPGKIDFGNLKKNKLITEDQENSVFENYTEKGVLASNGSIMKMAQKACIYKENQSKEKGLLLREHRRCYDEIIAFCNDLAYSGQLVPMKGKKGKDYILPPISIIHVEGNSIVRNKNRYNLNETEAISKWILNNKEIIETNYGKVENEVGIVTPFVGQKLELIKSLRNAGLSTNQMKIGTVHALQGAERPIILFSSVYGEGDTGTMFFDRDNKPNMLNVAVSRAKDSFIVFGNQRIFNSKTNKPSGILAKHLRL